MVLSICSDWWCMCIYITNYVTWILYHNQLRMSWFFLNKKITKLNYIFLQLKYYELYKAVKENVNWMFFNFHILVWMFFNFYILLWMFFNFYILVLILYYNQLRMYWFFLNKEITKLGFRKHLLNSGICSFWVLAGRSPSIDIPN